MTLRKENRSLLGTRSRLLTPMLAWILTQVLSAQSGPPLNPCDANPVTCAPLIQIDACLLPQTLADMRIVAKNDGSWDPDYQPGGGGVINLPKELKQLLFPSGSGYYGYRPCHRFVVDLFVAPRSYKFDLEHASETIAWNAGAWDLPSSGQDEMTFPPLLYGVANKPQVGYGDATANGLPSGSTSLPNNPDDCARFHEYVSIYKTTLPIPLPNPVFWTPYYSHIRGGVWQGGLPYFGGKCVLQCKSSFPGSGCTGSSSPISYPNADTNEHPVAYRFSIGTLLRTSWQQTGLVLWESGGGGN